MSKNKKEFYETESFKEWLEDYNTKAFFKNIEEAVDNKMEELKFNLLNTKPESKIDAEAIKNTICYCQAHLNTLNSYQSLKATNNDK